MGRVVRFVFFLGLLGVALWWWSGGSPVPTPPSPTMESKAPSDFAAAPTTPTKLKLPPRIVSRVVQVNQGPKSRAPEAPVVEGLEAFRAPAYRMPGVYEAAKVPTVWDKRSCRGRVPPAAKELGAFALARAGINGTNQYPRDLHIEKITQMWSEAGTYYQISARWEYTEPAGYRLEWFASDRADFGGEIRALEIPNVREPSAVDVRRATRIMNSLLSQAKSRGGAEGERRMSVTVSSADERRAPSRANFVNGTIQSYRDASYACEKNGDTARCRCGSSKGGEG